MLYFNRNSIHVNLWGLLIDKCIVVWIGMSWRNWYLVFGHGCDTTDSQMSPQPRRSWGCGDIWESVVSQPWPKTRYQFLFYHGTTKLTLNQESLSSQTASQLSKFKGQSNCKHWVTWPDCFATPSNHCDVTAGLVSLNYIDTLDKKMSQNRQWFKGNYKKKTLKIYC